MVNDGLPTLLIKNDHSKNLGNLQNEEILNFIRSELSRRSAILDKMHLEGSIEFDMVLINFIGEKKFLSKGNSIFFGGPINPNSVIGMSKGGNLESSFDMINDLAGMYLSYIPPALSGLSFNEHEYLTHAFYLNLGARRYMDGIGSANLVVGETVFQGSSIPEIDMRNHVPHLGAKIFMGGEYIETASPKREKEHIEYLRRHFPFSSNRPLFGISSGTREEREVVYEAYENAVNQVHDFLMDKGYELFEENYQYPVYATPKAVSELSQKGITLTKKGMKYRVD